MIVCAAQHCGCISCILKKLICRLGMLNVIITYDVMTKHFCAALPVLLLRYYVAVVMETTGQNTAAQALKMSYNVTFGAFTCRKSMPVVSHNTPEITTDPSKKERTT